MGIFDVLKFGTRPGKLNIDKEAFEATRAAYNHSTALERAMDVRGISTASQVKSKLIGSTAVGATTFGSVAAASSLAFDPSNTFDNTITAAGAGGAIGLLASTAINARRGRLGKITTTAQDYAHAMNSGQTAPKLSMKDALFSDSYQLQKFSKDAFMDYGSDAYNNAQKIFTERVSQAASYNNHNSANAGARARQNLKNSIIGAASSANSRVSSLRQSMFTTADTGVHAFGVAMSNVAASAAAGAAKNAAGRAANATSNAASSAYRNVSAKANAGLNNIKTRVANRAAVNAINSGLSGTPNGTPAIPTPTQISRAGPAKKDLNWTKKPKIERTRNWTRKSEGYLENGRYVTTNAKVSRNFEGLDAFSASERVASIHMSGSTFKRTYYNAAKGKGQLHAGKVSSARGRYSGYQGNIGAPKISSYVNI